MPCSRRVPDLSFAAVRMLLRSLFAPWVTSRSKLGAQRKRRPAAKTSTLVADFSCLLLLPSLPQYWFMFLSCRDAPPRLASILDPCHVAIKLASKSTSRFVHFSSKPARSPKFVVPLLFSQYWFMLIAWIAVQVLMSVIGIITKPGRESDCDSCLSFARVLVFGGHSLVACACSRVLRVLAVLAVAALHWPPANYPSRCYYLQALRIAVASAARAAP
jgi:hypothetical protein